MYFLFFLVLGCAGGAAVLFDQLLIGGQLLLRELEDGLAGDAGEGVLPHGLQLACVDGDSLQGLAVFEGVLADGRHVLADGHTAELFQALAGGAFDLGDLVGLAVGFHGVLDDQGLDILLRGAGEGGLAAAQACKCYCRR